MQYTGPWALGEDIPQKSHYVGNSVKSMHISVEASLAKLKTSYIDIFYVHFWDYTASVKEVMDGLHALVMQGKVLYLVRLCSILSKELAEALCHREFRTHLRRWFSLQLP